MDVWRTAVLFLFLGVVLYLLREFVISKEHFQSAPTRAPARAPVAAPQTRILQPVSNQILSLELEDTEFRAEASATEVQQNLTQNRDKFHYGLGPSGFRVPASVVENIPDLATQLDQATFTSGNPVRISQSMLVEEQKGPTLADRLQVCQSISRPEDIPADNPSQCGWWHVPDISGGNYQSSYCVPGSDQGPNVNLTGLPRNGTWFWSKDAAIAAEAKKYCKRATSCSLQDTTISCAFCEEKGYSIPYDRETGQILYGEQCTRLHPTSATCPTSSSDIACLTETTELGKKNCISTLMQINGIIYDKGLLHRYVYGKLATEEKTRFGLLLNVLNTRARWRSDILEINDIDPDVAGGAIKSTHVLDYAGLTRKIKKIVAAVNSYDPVVKGIAKLFVDGTPFDSSAYYYQLAQPGTTSLETNQNNLALQDLQQEFRKAGCQAAGADYPQSLPPTTASLSEHGRTYQALYQSMNTEEDQKQEDAIRRCLNATYRVSVPAPPAAGTFCNEPGIEYLIFSPMTGPQATLIGRILSPVGLLGDASSYSEANTLRDVMRTGPLNDVLQVGYIARTMFQLDTGAGAVGSTGAPSSATNVLASSWTIPPTGTYVLRVNGQEIATRAGSPGPVIPYAPNTRTLLEIQYTIETTDRNQRDKWGKPEYAYMLQNLRKFRLIQESYKPLIHFDFAMSSQDINRIARLVGGFQYSPRFTSAPSARAPSAAPIFGLVGSSTRMTPRLRSSMIQIIDCTVNLQSSGRIFTLSESESYMEYFSVESNQLKYVVLNGSQNETFTAPLPADVTPFGASRRFVLVFTKQALQLTVQFFTAAPMQSLQSLATVGPRIIQGNLGFNRSLEVAFGAARFESFKLYERKGGRTEGFQNPSDVPAILLEDGTRRYTEEAVAPKVDASTYIPNTILKDKDNQTLFAGAQFASPTAATVGNAVCRYPEVSIGSESDFRYTEKYQYNQRFANADVESTDTKESLKACYDACRSRTGCVGMSYAADSGTCTYYRTISSAAMTPQANTVSMIMPGQDKTLVDMRSRTKAAIESYKRMREALATSKFPLANRSISMEEITRDLASVETVQNVDCLNAFLQKYTLNTK